MMTAFFIFILGTVFGSFASAILHRARHGGSVWRGRSRCTKCGVELRALDLIPIISFFMLRGRCRACRAPISWQYPALEAAMGVLFAASYLHACGLTCNLPALAFCSPNALRLMFFSFFLALVFVYDARHGEIPDSFSLTGFAAALIFNLSMNFSFWWQYLLSAAVGASFFGLQYILGKGKWVGSGDIFLGAMMGMMCGWPDVIVAFAISYFLGLMAAGVFIISGKKTLKDTIPLGPFLALGTAVVLLTPMGDMLRAFYVF